MAGVVKNKGMSKRPACVESGRSVSICGPITEKSVRLREALSSKGICLCKRRKDARKCRAVDCRKAAHAYHRIGGAFFPVLSYFTPACKIFRNTFRWGIPLRFAVRTFRGEANLVIGEPGATGSATPCHGRAAL